jgi:hypothetical protein
MPKASLIFQLLILPSGNRLEGFPSRADGRKRPQIADRRLWSGGGIVASLAGIAYMDIIAIFDLFPRAARVADRR